MGKTVAIAQATTEANIIQIRKQAYDLSTRVEEFAVESVEDVGIAADILKSISVATAGIEAEQGKYLSKLKELEAIERGRWKPSLDLLAAADKSLRDAVKEFRKVEQTTAQKAEAAVMKRVEKGTLKLTTGISKVAELQANAMGKSIKSANGATASFKTLTKLAITDEKKIPREYLTPDKKAIEAALKSGIAVPGCGLTTEETLAIK